MKNKIFKCLIVLFVLSCSNSYGGDSKVAPLSGPRIAGSAAVIGECIYYIGGITDEGVETGLTEKYDSGKNIWTKKKSMPTMRAGINAIRIDNFIYVVGGRKGNKVLSLVEKYDTVSNAWTKCAPMPTARWYFMAAAYNGKIYAIGGIEGVGDNRNTTGAVEVYNPIQDKWDKLTSMPIARSNASVAVLGKYIYIISGRTGTGIGPSTTKRVDRYEPTKDIWSQISSLNNSRTGSEACVVNKKIYVIGGAAKSSIFSSIEMYDPNNDKWENYGQLKIQRTDHAVVNINNSIYVIGGMSRPSLSAFLKSVEKVIIQ